MLVNSLRNNEVQFAGEIQPKGSRYRVEFPSGDQKMLNRQVVKSETATIKVLVRILRREQLRGGPASTLSASTLKYVLCQFLLDSCCTTLILLLETYTYVVCRWAIQVWNCVFFFKYFSFKSIKALYIYIYIYIWKETFSD